MTSKHVLAIIAVVALVAAFAVPAQKQAVICKDGRRLEGEVTKVKDGYQIRMKGGTVVIAKDQVLKVEDVTTDEDELTKRLGEIDSRDAEGHYQVARLAYKKGLLTYSQKILKKVLKLDPKHENAPKLLKLVNMGIAKSGDTPTPTTTTKNGGKKPAPSKFLTKEDIYRIRLMELKSDDRVSIQYRNKVLQRFIKSMRGSGDFENKGFENKFRKYNRVKQVLYILEWTDRENTTIRDDILIKTDPKVMREFRARIWPVIAKSFASPSCYGGVKPRDGLKLFNIKVADDRVVYTNFYILHKWERNGRKMIDRDNPEMSLLLQYGLPEKLAKYPKPKYVPGPIFTGKNDRSYKTVKNWIASLRRLFPPGYRIKYTLPGQKPVKPTPTTTPATPATKPGKNS
jgi:hypothetical protein